MQRNIFFILFYLGICLSASAQQHFNNWFFGKGAGITFNTTPPSPLTGGQLSTFEGCASVSDNAGNLLFYSDGTYVWDRTHTTMPNGTELKGHSSSAQGIVIVPVPGSSKKYYLFTVNEWRDAGELRYSVVDMNMNNGKGDVVPSQKNILISTGVSEQMVAATGIGCGVWLITHQRNNSKFEVYPVTASGVGSVVISDVGSVLYTTPPLPYEFPSYIGTLKVSKDNKRVGIGTLNGQIEIFDFNNVTGVLSNVISLHLTPPLNSYSVCFSPDASKFYVTEQPFGTGFDIFQYDLTQPIANIPATKTPVGHVGISSIGLVGDMQIGPDNKIYIARPQSKFLAIIPSPNNKAPACGFTDQGVSLGNAISESGLPSDVRTATANVFVDLGVDTAMCIGETLTLNATTSAPDLLWSTGATGTSIQVTSPGKYWVRLQSSLCSASDTILVGLKYPAITIGKDTTICSDKTLILDAGLANTYVWSTGATTQTITVSTPGTYSVTAKYGGTCAAADTVKIDMMNCDCDVMMPSAFSPNNDRKNDVFKPLNSLGCDAIQLAIYNRFGQKIFESNNWQEGWDGTINRVMQPPGVYVYVIRTMKGQVINIKKGSVLLIR